MANKNLKFAPALVTCGLGSGQYCTPCDLWTLAKNIVDFLVKPPSGLAFPVLVLALLIGGVVWATSAGNPNRIELGKKVITSSIIGIFIAFGGWLIVDTIINTLVSGSPTFAWQKIEGCAKPIVTPITPILPPIGITLPTGIDIIDNKNAANSLSTSGVLFSGKGDCKDTGGNAVSAATNLGELQRGESLTVCKNGCKTGGDVCVKSGTLTNPMYLNRNILQNLQLAKSAGNNFNITSLATGDHSANSDHYQGKAADLISLTAQDYINLRNQLQALPGAAKNKTFCEDINGNVVPDCNLIKTTHLHFSVQ